MLSCDLLCGSGPTKFEEASQTVGYAHVVGSQNGPRNLLIHYLILSFWSSPEILRTYN